MRELAGGSVSLVLSGRAGVASTMSLFLFFAIVTTVSGQKFLQLSLHDVCRDGPEVWRCKIMTDCPGLKDFIDKGQKPDICSFSGRDPIVCCPSFSESLAQTRPTTKAQPTKRPPTRATTRPTNQPSPTFKPFTWNTNSNQITESRPVWGSSWTTKPTAYPTNKPETLSATSTSKAEKMCKEYGKYVYRVEVSPILIGNSEPEKIVTNECNIQTLIIGGIDARPKEFPHMALIGYGERPSIQWLCGGSLISPKFVLSAAHCSKPGGRIAKWVRLGDLDTAIENDDARPVERRIIKIHDHPDYNNEVLYNDIALYELESAVKLNTYIRPICLYTEKEITGRAALASGWGHTSWGGRGSSMLQKVNLSMVNNENCNKVFGKGEYRKQLPNNVQDSLMICAGGEPGKDTCQGDSGGPLQVEHKNVFCMYSQIGVVSFGKGCALSYPGVYTRVSHYIPWIENIVWP